jgi:hypothetical protein
MENSSAVKSNASFFSKHKTGVLVLIFSLIVFAIVACVLIEAAKKNEYVIKNKTGMDIEYVRVYFQNSDLDYEYTSEDIINTPVSAHSKVRGAYTTPSDLENSGSSLMFEVKFEGKDATEDYSGYFNTEYDGKIIMIFYTDPDDSDNVLMKVKAGEGLTNSADNTFCDEVISLFDDKIVN